MREIYIKSKVGLLPIGRRGENLATRVIYPGVPEEGQSVTVFVKRSGDSVAYPASQVEVTDTEIIWTVTSIDAGKSGRGKVQYRFSDSVTGEVIKTEIYGFLVGLAIDTEVGPAPDPYESWLDSLTDLAGQAQVAARDAEASATAADESAESASESAQSAEQSASSAGTYATNAQTSATTATQKAAQAAASEANAQTYATQAQASAVSAEASATSAGESAESARESAGSASVSKTSAEEASQSAHEWGLFSQTYASQAATSATSAGQSATAASASATSASQSATTATSKASEASASATTATTKASEASASATAAQEARTGAETAQAGAESAAETAQAGADAVGLLREQIYNSYPSVEAEAGPIVSITDGADGIPVKSLVVGIEPPVQDLHGYDSPWPAGGGVNKCPSPLQTTTTKSGITFTCDGKGECSLSGTASYGAVFDFLIDEVVLPSTVYVHLFNSNYYTEHIPIIDFMNGSTRVDFVGINVTQNRIYNGTPDMGGKTINGICIRVPPGFTGSVTFKIYISDSNAVVDFSPYSNICPISGWTGANIYRYAEYDAEAQPTYPITFPSSAGTVYGGSLDVTNGVLTVDRAMIASYAGETLSGEWISDRDVYAEGVTPTTGAQVVYELATPVTYQLTPVEVTTLLGSNNIWADTGDTSLAYRADTKLYIDEVFEDYQDDLADYADALAALG